MALSSRSIVLFSQNPLQVRVHCFLLDARCLSMLSRGISYPVATLIPKSSLRCNSCGYCGKARHLSIFSIVNRITKEKVPGCSVEAVRAGSKLGLLTNEIVEDRESRRSLEKGLLLEFRKDPERVLLAVALKPDGKKNWVVCDQNGVTSSIRPQQVTYIIPDIENFDPTQISDFLHRAQDLLDPTILEYAWAELKEKNRTVTDKTLAEILYGSMQALESYCAHLLLSKDEIYFAVSERKGFHTVYEARSTIQVEELLRRQQVKEACEKELEEFVQMVLSAKSSHHSKPIKDSSMMEKFKHRIEALEAYAIDDYKNDEQRKIAGTMLRAMGLPKTSSAAVNLLIDVGHFPYHVNLDLLKYNVRTEYSDEAQLAADDLLQSSFDLDEMHRKDFTHLKVYAIDVDEADELDDALSAIRLEDGRIRVWIHVADPTSLVQPQSLMDREALRRGTSLFLPTGTYPMFPEKLAMEKMSLQQGELCNSVSISATLNSDGSIAEYSVDNSVVRPTYMLTYESASELLHLNLKEETELRILSEAASLRLQWRLHQGAIDTATIEPRIKVPNPDDPEPTIKLYVENQANPAMRLVTEMMLLCGEVIATFGSQNNIPLPYRGQPQSNMSTLAFSHLPEGPVRSAAYVKLLRAAEMSFQKPIRHGILGLPGYVQFSSPIRRYTDVLAHYQVKAFLRGDPLPFSAGQLEGITSLVNMQSRLAKKLYNTSLRYWLLEYLRRQPKDKRYQALIIRFVKDRWADLLLLEVGIQASTLVSVGKQVGDEVEVKVVQAHPRKDVLEVEEA